MVKVALEKYKPNEPLGEKVRLSMLKNEARNG